MDGLRIFDNMDVFRIEGFLTEDECNELIKMYEDVYNIQKKKNGRVQKFVPFEPIRDKLSVYVKERLLDKYDLVYGDLVPDLERGIMDTLTFSIHPKGHHLGLHVDTWLGPSTILKFIIYLNRTVGGGTIFVPVGKHPGKDSVVVEPGIGDLVIFDIGLRHGGAPILDGTKYLLGFRLHWKPIQ
ncbi:MAG: oxidoreductase, 2OG-Fe(II) oxygenase [Harvfovirus sp.]|uniref:Oxidoreductase, 2OG-Fe(II) oxygenase n=1 Tax=Harvfovirus sp. TaxID=2487768 RepID=A0A3G5A004_9VIRU|nr:MAG: oxidoreductase, 2OG-Fe(II) oxygenase [Harvfovirus sp.]